MSEGASSRGRSASAPTVAALPPMGKARLEAFSDGVFAILITIMVLDLKVPHAPDLTALRAIVPVFLSYLLSFVFLGIYWSNHHHLLHAIHQVNGRILWANLHLMFWLSLVPFVTNWMGKFPLESGPVALYGIVLWFSGCAYYMLSRALVDHHGEDSVLAKALGRDLKGKASLALYSCAVPLAFAWPGVAWAVYLAVAILWLCPDRRIERVLPGTF